MATGRPDRVLEHRGRAALRIFIRRGGRAQQPRFAANEISIGFIELRSQLRRERRWSGELRHTGKDGREVIVDFRMQLLDDDTVLEVNRDVTAAAVFRAVFNQTGIFAGVMDLQGYLREANNYRWSGADTQGSRCWAGHFGKRPGGAVRRR